MRVFRSRTTSCVLGLALALVSACSNTIEPASPATDARADSADSSSAETSTPGSAELPADALRADDWTVWVLERQGLEMPLPDRTRWRRPKRTSSFTELVHEPTGSWLGVRAWPARRTVTREECERDLFLRRPDLKWPVDEETLTTSFVHDQAIAAPPGYGSRLRIWVDVQGQGIALLTGAGLNRCVAAAFRTKGEAAALGRRLRLVGELMFPRLQTLEITEHRIRENGA